MENKNNKIILFNNEYFKTKTAVKKHITDIVNSIHIEEIIDEKHRHFHLFMKLLYMHSSKLEILTKGLHYFVFLVGFQFKERQLNAVCMDKKVYTLTYNYSKLNIKKFKYNI